MTFHRKDDLEARLRNYRREPEARFVESVSKGIRSERRSLSAQSWRVVFVGGLASAMLIVLASVGGLSYAASGFHAVKAAVSSKPKPALTSAAAQYGHKTTLCHKGHTITVDDHAVPAHLRHHDTLGPCPTGGVLGAQSTSANGGVLGATAGDPSALGATANGNLPFTGASLGLALAVGLFLLTTGIALRMRARRS